MLSAANFLLFLCSPVASSQLSVAYCDHIPKVQSSDDLKKRKSYVIFLTQLKSFDIRLYFSFFYFVDALSTFKMVFKTNSDKQAIFALVEYFVY